MMLFLVNRSLLLTVPHAFEYKSQHPLYSLIQYLHRQLAALYRRHNLGISDTAA
ncbi:hypothetical protein D3C80_1830130 [compost metagenome]